MGLTLSNLATRAVKLFNNVQDARLLLVGLDGAGKTTLLYKFKVGEAGTPVGDVCFVAKFFALLMRIPFAMHATPCLA
jgi:ABC-type uncharacterized transport system ATPase subunit